MLIGYRRAFKVSECEVVALRDKYGTHHLPNALLESALHPSLIADIDVLDGDVVWCCMCRWGGRKDLVMSSLVLLLDHIAHVLLEACPLS